mmetsp:Transcript_69805/g.164222  ORF Transcript_69805/g.164222 Transcript_69805/m.164222 type:complete len:104 (+) Transcript_69805:255-566(+)
MAKHSGLATRAECIVAMSTEETDTDNTAATLPTRQPPTARTITITVTVNVTVTVDVVAGQQRGLRHRESESGWHLAMNAKEDVMGVMLAAAFFAQRCVLTYQT